MFPVIDRLPDTAPCQYTTRPTALADGRSGILALAGAASERARAMPDASSPIRS